MQHYYSKDQSSKLVLKQIDVSIRNIRLKLLTASGVFSKKGIDKGTELLVKSMIIKPSWEVLDIGCGYGILGLFAAKLSGNIPYLTDINKRACKIAAINAKNNNIEAIILNGNLYEPVKDKRFDTILINPPQTAGKEICIAMINQSINHLKQDGLLQLVARPNKGGRTLSSQMKAIFGNLDVIARQSRYAVYAAKYINT